MAGRPDPKPDRRVRNRREIARARKREPVCVVCRERRTESAHHGWKAGQGGDDVAANLFGVCGDGARLCHGLLEANDAITLTRLGRYVLTDRPDFVEYVVGKLDGDRSRADAWLERHLFITQPIGGHA